MLLLTSVHRMVVTLVGRELAAPMLESPQQPHHVLWPPLPHPEMNFSVIPESTSERE